LSTVTKIFVVLHVVLSIAFVAWSVQFAANVFNWKEQSQKWEELARQADTYSRNVTAISAAKEEALNQRITELVGQSEELKRQIETAQADHEKTKSQLAEAQRKNDGLNASFAKLSSQFEMMQEGWKEARAQRDKLDKDVITLQTRSQDLNLRNDELTSKNLVLAEQVRQLKQQNYALRDQTAQLQSKLNMARTAPPETVGPKLDGVTEATPAAESPIRGSIVEINGQVASIDVGSKDGVRPGMNFVIHRSGGTYLGELAVSEVEPNQSAGRLNLQEGTSLKVGDLVTDEAGLGK
jgi:hypothetical protein